VATANVARGWAPGVTTAVFQAFTAKEMGRVRFVVGSKTLVRTGDILVGLILQEGAVERLRQPLLKTREQFRLLLAFPLQLQQQHIGSML
jgi:hypothetical protein